MTENISNIVHTYFNKMSTRLENIFLTLGLCLFFSTAVFCFGIVSACFLQVADCFSFCVRWYFLHFSKVLSKISLVKLAGHAVTGCNIILLYIGYA